MHTETFECKVNFVLPGRAGGGSVWPAGDYSPWRCNYWPPSVYCAGHRNPALCMCCHAPSLTPSSTPALTHSLLNFLPWSVFHFLLHSFLPHSILHALPFHLPCLASISPCPPCLSPSHNPTLSPPHPHFLRLKSFSTPNLPFLNRSHSHSVLLAEPFSIPYAIPHSLPHAPPHSVPQAVARPVLHALSNPILCALPGLVLNALPQFSMPSYAHSSTLTSQHSITLVL